jgi:hypothetical protein
MSADSRTATTLTCQPCIGYGRDDSGSGCVEPRLNVVGPLAGSEFDDAKVGKTVPMKWIFLDDGFDVLPTLADGQDDPTISRYLSTRDQEVAGRVVFLQKPDVRSHVRVNFIEAGLVNEFDDEHREPACIKRP